MIDKDQSGSLTKQEIIEAVQGNKKVIQFLVNCEKRCPRRLASRRPVRPGEQEARSPVRS